MTRNQTRRKPISKGLRYSVLERDKFTCQYCGRSAPEAKLTIDHIIPVSANGDNDYSNLVACCIDCNGGKGSKLSLRPVDNEDLASKLKAMKERRRLLLATIKAEKAVRELVEERTWEVARYWIESFNGRPAEGQPWSINKRFFAFLSAVLEWLPNKQIFHFIDLTYAKYMDGKIRREDDAMKYFAGCVRNQRAELDGRDNPNGDKP